MSDGGRFFKRVRPWPTPPPDDVQDAVPPHDATPLETRLQEINGKVTSGQWTVDRAREALADVRGLSEVEMQMIRDGIRRASAEQLTLMIALVFTQIRESGYVLSAPIESVVYGQPPAWRVLDENRREIGRVSFDQGEWKRH